jgi:hypothetical protein
MGLWGESAAVAREILATAEAGRHPNYQPVVAAMARVLLAEALLGDLRVEEACATARAAGSGPPGAAWFAARAARVRARCLDLERRAGSPEGRAVALLAHSRRLRERGDEAAAQATCFRAFQAFSAIAEARLCAARESLRAGRPQAASALAQAVLDGEGSAQLRPFAHLVIARARESEGERGEALLHYRRAWDEPLGRVDVRAEAAAAIRRLEPGGALPEAPPLER